MASENNGVLKEVPNKLTAKVKIDGPNAVTEEVLNKAQDSLLELADDFVEHVGEDVADLRAAQQKLSSGEGDPAEHLAQLFHVGHNLKGKGGTFDFDLLTYIANQLCRFLEKIEPPLSKLTVEVIVLHIDAIQLVHIEKLTGDGGAIGDKLLTGLEQVMKKWEQTK